MAGAWQFLRCFRSVCNPSFWVMAMVIGGVTMVGLAIYMEVCWLFRSEGVVGF